MAREARKERPALDLRLFRATSGLWPRGVGQSYRPEVVVSKMLLCLANADWLIRTGKFDWQMRVKTRLAETSTGRKLDWQKTRLANAGI